MPREFTEEFYATLDDYMNWRRENGMPLIAYRDKETSPKRQHSINLTDNAWDRLQEIASKFRYNTQRGGNISALLEAIGNDLLQVYDPESLDETLYEEGTYTKDTNKATFHRTNNMMERGLASD